MTRGFTVLSGLTLAAAALLGGCVERKMVVRSDPAGAHVLLDLAEQDATTPATIPFEFGGTRLVTLVAPGYEVLDAHAELRDPWYTWFPFDLFAEVLWPGTIEDVQEFEFTLRPYHPGDERFSDAQRAEVERRSAELRARAEAYRRGGSDGPAAPAAAPADEPPPPPAPSAR